MLVFKKLGRDKIAMACILVLSIIMLAGIFAPYIAPNDPLKISMALKYAGPSHDYPLGNDQLGRCVLSRLIFGIRPSVFYVLLIMVITLLIGTVVGSTAGFIGGKIDEFLMRLCDIMLSFPTEVTVLAVVGIFGVSMKVLLIACIFTRWVWFAKLIRASVQQYKEANYVRFAKAAGQSSLRIITKHILPSVTSEIAVYASNNIGGLIMVLAGFSFLGIGVQAPSPEWGMMLSEAKNVMVSRPLLILPPGIAIMIVVCAFSFLGDSLRDALDPQYTGRGKDHKSQAGEV